MHLNTMELTLLTVAVVSVYVYLRLVFKNSKYSVAVLLAALSLPALLLSIDRTTQFLTVDEINLFAECIELPTGVSMYKYNQWNQGSFHTSEAIFSSLFSLLSVQHWNIENVQMLGKGLHWFGALLLALWIHFLLNKHFISSKIKCQFYAIFIFTVLLLPTNALASKIFQYDIYAMFFGVIALLYITISFQTGEKRPAIISVLIAALAAQEKMSASPVLMLCILLLAFHNVKYFYKNRPLFGTLAGVLQGFFLAMVVILCTFITIVAIRHWNFPDMRLGKLAWPMIAYIMPALRLIYGGAIGMPDKHLASFLLAISVSLCIVGSLLLIKLEYLILRFSITKRTGGLLLLCVITTAVLSFFFGSFYLYGESAGTGMYIPHVYFNDITYHFFSHSLWEHVARFVARSYELFVVAIPTVFWAPFLFYFSRGFKKILPDFKAPLFWKFMVILGFLPPLAIGLAQYALVARYANLPLFIFALSSIILLTFIMDRISKKSANTCAFVFILLLLLEIYPFAPLYGGPFRPIWANYPAQYQKPSPRIMKVNWPGWGEELMLVGQAIATKEHKDINQIKLHYDFKSRWLGTKMQRIVKPYHQPELENLTENDYFIFSRIYITQKPAGYFPSKVEPYMILQFRGQPQAWVFPGDQLQKAGYRFPVIPENQ